MEKPFDSPADADDLARPPRRPPELGEDPALDAVEKAILKKDASGAVFAAALRETFDALYDGQRTGRYALSQLYKTEKTHMGTMVEIELQRAFRFADGKDMDFEIAKQQVDCKYSKDWGGWMIPPEAYDHSHLCLVVWADDLASKFRVGLLRAVDDGYTLGAVNRDAKRKVTAYGADRVRMLYGGEQDLPENTLLHIDEDVRDRIFEAGPNDFEGTSGQARVNRLFDLVQGKIINRASLLAVARQKDAMKRARDARLPENLGQFGIIVLGHQERDPVIARALGLQVPKKGEFISARVCETDLDYAGKKAEIEGRYWRLAGEDDAQETAPVIPRVRRLVAIDESDDEANDDEPEAVDSMQ